MSFCPTSSGSYTDSALSSSDKTAVNHFPRSDPLTINPASHYPYVVRLSRPPVIHKIDRMSSLSPTAYHSTEPVTPSTYRTDPRKPARRKQRHPRKPTSCGPCRISKLRCDRQLPCGACRRRNNSHRCKYDSAGSSSPTRPTESTPTTRSFLDPRTEATTSSQNPLSTEGGHNRLASAHADRESQDFTRTSWESLWQRPAQQRTMPGDQTYFPFASRSNATPGDLLDLLPPVEWCDYLLIQYFTYMAPMFHVLHEATFQRQYNSFTKDSRTDDMSWLALLFSILSLSVQTIEHNDPVLAKIRERVPCPGDNAAIASELRQVAMACLSRDNFMFHYSLTTLESLLILTYGISHDFGVDAAWTLLGMSLQLPTSAYIES